MMIIHKPLLPLDTFTKETLAKETVIEGKIMKQPKHIITPYVSFINLFLFLSFLPYPKGVVLMTK
jgi:hypothetical protein